MTTQDGKIKLIPYNTGMHRLILPEYGRTVQDMAMRCLDIADRDERTRCAYAIIQVMKTLSNDKTKENDDKKYWDHLHIMSDFRLDVDSPYPAPDKEEFTAKPAPIPYSGSRMGKRQYGRILQRMVTAVADLENGPDKDVLVELVANHMKKQLTVVNKESADNGRVFADLAEFSDGRISLTPDIFPLADFTVDPKSRQQNGKKKKKNIDLP